MTRKPAIAALALAFSLLGSAAMACGPDGCGKDKDGKATCCCDKGGHADHGSKPDGQKPAAPKDGEAKEHKH